jgi:hypothetical protein
MSEQNKAVARKMLEMVWNEGKVAEAIAECRAPSCVSRGLAADPLRDQKQYEEFVKLVQAVITDTRFTFDQMVAEGDSVAFRASLTGKSKKRGSRSSCAASESRGSSTGRSSMPRTAGTP